LAIISTTAFVQQSNLGGHGIHNFRTQSAQEQRSSSRHREERYEPSSEGSRQLPRGANGHVQRIFIYKKNDKHFSEM